MTVIDHRLRAGLDQFSPPEKLGFGRILVPIMYQADYQDGQWREGRLLPYQSIATDPAAKIFHYGQSVFEGMKAYRVNQDKPELFRPKANWNRMNCGARRLCMPEVPWQLFIDGSSYVTAWSQEFIPTSTNQSLYLRPFMIATSADLSIGNSAAFSFIVIASPSEAYHSGAMKVFIERSNCRAAIGGTGNVKVGGNYAAAMLASVKAEQAGYHQCLWLDPEQHRHVEELSGMNVFAVIEGELHTPELTDTLLPGITRDSILKLAPTLGYKVHERCIDIDELILGIGKGQCTEMFACGTAAVISPISLLGDANEAHYPLPVLNDVAERIHTALLDIQEARAVDSFEWRYQIPQHCFPEYSAANSVAS